MNLTGTISGTRNNGGFSVPIATSAYDAIPYYTKVHSEHASERALGLFNLERSPKVKVYCVPQTRNGVEGYMFYVSADIGKIVINPITGAKIVGVGIAPGYHINPPSSTQPIYLNTTLESSIGYSRRTGTLGHWIPLRFPTLPNLVSPDLFKLYLKFDLGGGRIAEVVKTYVEDFSAEYLTGPLPPGSDPVTPLPDIIRENVFLATSPVKTDFAVGGDGNWFGTGFRGPGEATLAGVSTVASPDLTENQSAWFEATVSGSSLEFDVKTDTEANYDYFNVYVDGVLQTAISGSTPWSHHTVSMSNGTHKIRFEYIKDYSVSEGADRVWLDNLVIR
jgi:hypothetical protein